MQQLVEEIVSKLSYYGEKDRRHYLATLYKLDQQLYVQVVHRFREKQLHSANGPPSQPTYLDSPPPKDEPNCETP